MKYSYYYFLIFTLSILMHFSCGKKYLGNLVNEINSMQSNWKAEENALSYLDTNQLKKLMGLKKRPVEEVSNEYHHVTDVPDNLPKTFDARVHWPGCPSIKSIKDQSNCGSCWAVASAAAMSDKLCISTDNNVSLNLSAEALMTCCTNCTDGDPGCDGGYLLQSWKYWKWHGLCTGGDYGSKEGCQPYSIKPCNDCSEEARTPSCIKNKCTNKSYKKSYRRDLHRGKHYYYLGKNLTQIQAELFKNGPLVTGFVVYRDFMNYKSGVYQHTTGSMLGYHAVRVLGWGVATVGPKGKKKQVPYWLVANSWGSEWGTQGTFKIIRGTNDCEFEENFVGGVYNSRNNSITVLN